MTHEEKELLLKDISARLPYGTIVSVTDGTIKYNAYIESVSYKNIQVSPVSDSNFTAYTFYKISEIKLYLRPMSSMTAEEREEYRKFSYYGAAGIRDNDFTEMIAVPSFEKMDYLNSHHLDYRGLIEKGLAIKVTEENNPYK